MSILDDFLKFFYPDLCVVCGQILNRHEKVLCLPCLFKIPRTGFCHDSLNPVSQLFWGRVRIENAASFFYYNKGSAYQSIIHKLKYNGRKDIGIEMGRIYASELGNTVFKGADFIVPVPLHPSRLRERGYNQSEMIAKGLSDGLKIPLKLDLLCRTESTSTQTRKSRFERFRNIDGKFLAMKDRGAEGKHIVLTDDVVTTGSTLESCASALLELPGTKVSILTLATA